MKNLILYTFLVFIILGCKGEQGTTPKKKVETPLKNKGIINWAFFTTEGLENISFPVWVNDSIVAKRNINKINLFVNEFDHNSDSTFQDTIPSRIYEVSFTKGRLNEIYVREFAEEIAIEEQWFRYRNKKDSLGYSLPDITNKVIYEENEFLPIFSTLQNAQQYKRLAFFARDSATIQYVNTLHVNKEKHVFIKDSTNWNVHFIDQKFDNPEQHIFYYGIPNKHYESFIIKNLVEKDQISSNKYFDNNCIYQHSTYANGFETRRTFSYDSKGRVIGLIDSLIVNPNDFIERLVSIVKYKNELPVFISSYKSQDSLSKNPIKEIRFDYVFDE
jgi:hypothetical protein